VVQVETVEVIVLSMGQQEALLVVVQEVPLVSQVDVVGMQVHLAHLGREELVVLLVSF
jgi:hypothetical protein